MKGICKWFNDSKGYGFIKASGGKEIFVTWQDVEPNKLKHQTLTEGQSVEFDVAETKYGPTAKRVR